MSILPVPNNTTCDVYTSALAVRETGVPILLTPCFPASHVANINAGSPGTLLRFTHIALVPLGTDIRDGYIGNVTGTPPTESTPDEIFVPSHATGTPFFVLFVERTAYGTPQDCLRVYLQRGTPPWPTQNL